MKKTINEVTLIEFECIVNELDFESWFYDRVKMQGIIILKEKLK